MSIFKSISSLLGINASKDDAQKFMEILLMNDVSYQTAEYLTSKAKRNEDIQKEIVKILKNCEAKLKITTKPYIIFIYGVNGSGKTSTIVKLVNMLQKQGKKVLVSACDTFRSAAPQQLATQLEKINCQTVVPLEEKTDPASVAFIASKRTLAENFDILIVDTAGRLHTNANLMQELQKIHKVTTKNLPDSQYCNIAIMDSTIGQNSISQINHFNSIIPISGIIVTKLDTSAKGGAVISIAYETKKKVYFTCFGTDIENISPFDAESFSKNFLE